MLTEDAKVDSSSTRQLLPSSVNISAEYPALPDHDSMNNPSIFVAPPYVNYVDRTVHRQGDAKFNSRQITLFWETPNFIAAKICWFTVYIFPWHGSCVTSGINSYSASHGNWCTETLWNRIMTAQCEGIGEVGSARYEPALLPPCPSIRVLSYSNCQEIHSRQQTGLAVC